MSRGAFNIHKGSIAVALLLSAIFLGLVPPAHAANPSLVTTCKQLAGPGTAATCSLASVSGDVALVGIIWTQESSSCPPVLNGVPTDTEGNTYTTLYSNICAAVPVSGFKFDGQVFSAPIASTNGANVITLTFSSSVTLFQLVTFDVNGLPTVALAGSAVGTGTTAGAGSGSVAAITYGAQDVLIGLLGCDASGHACWSAAGSGFTIASVAQDFVDAQWSTSVAVTSPSTFPFSIAGANDWIEMGVVIGASSAIVSQTVVVGCTFFELQCWWFPTLFLALYLVPFLVLGKAADVSDKGMTYLMLGGLANASMIEVIMGIMNIVVPFMIIILLTIYQFRFALRQAITGALSRGGEAVTS